MSLSFVLPKQCLFLFPNVPLPHLGQNSCITNTLPCWIFYILSVDLAHCFPKSCPVLYFECSRVRFPPTVPFYSWPSLPSPPNQNLFAFWSCLLFSTAVKHLSCGGCVAIGCYTLEWRNCCTWLCFSLPSFIIRLKPLGVIMSQRLADLLQPVLPNGDPPCISFICCLFNLITCFMPDLLNLWEFSLRNIYVYVFFSANSSNHWFLQHIHSIWLFVPHPKKVQNNFSNE